jgi:hypothetical protein
MKLFQRTIQLPFGVIFNGMNNILSALLHSPSLETIFVEELCCVEVVCSAVAKSKSIKYILIMNRHVRLGWEGQWQRVQDLMKGSVIQIVVTDGTWIPNRPYHTLLVSYHPIQKMAVFDQSAVTSWDKRRRDTERNAHLKRLDDNRDSLSGADRTDVRRGRRRGRDEAGDEIDENLIIHVVSLYIIPKDHFIKHTTLLGRADFHAAVLMAAAR